MFVIDFLSKLEIFLPCWCIAAITTSPGVWKFHSIRSINRQEQELAVESDHLFRKKCYKSSEILNYMMHRSRKANHA